MNRFKFSDNDDGSGAYELSINPTSVDFQDGELYNLASIKDGPSVRQSPIYDDRVRTMTWEGCRKGFTLLDNQMTVLEGYVGKEKYFWEEQVGKFTWVKIKIIDLKKTYRPGGKIIYQAILSFIVTDSDWSGF